MSANCGTVRVMDDTWTNRDLPVLKAVVEIYDATGRTMFGPRDIEARAGLDQEVTERAIRALYRQPYFETGTASFGGHYFSSGRRLEIRCV